MVSYDTVEVETDELPLGESRVVTEGSDGYTTVTYRVEFHDGVEHSREEQSRETTEPIDEVIEIGIRDDSEGEEG